MIDWLNDNSGAVQALAAVVLLCVTVVLVVVTAWYARETRNIAKATGEQAKASTRLAKEARETRLHEVFPEVTVDVYVSSLRTLCVAADNHGPGTAYHLACYPTGYPDHSCGAPVTLKAGEAVGKSPQTWELKRPKDKAWNEKPTVEAVFYDVLGTRYRAGVEYEVDLKTGALKNAHRERATPWPLESEPLPLRSDNLAGG